MTTRLRASIVIPLLGLFSGTAAFADAVTLDPFLPGGTLVYASTYSPSAGVTSHVTNLVAVVPFTADTPATAFASLTNGAVGINIVGKSDGSGANAGAGILVNLTFQGTGDNIVNFDVDGTFGVQGNPITNAVLLGAGITCTSVNTPSVGQYQECGTVRANEYSEDNGPSFGPGNISFPVHLALAFHTDANDTQFQFGFGLTGSAVGAASLNAIHTGLISFDLAPGVTMDQPNGFLTTPGDYILPGEGNPSAVPEPSMFAAMACGLVALAGRRAWQSRRS